MSLTALGHSLELEKISTKTTVPDNDYAKLMYYLNCVSSIVDFDIPRKYINYDEYYNLSYSEKKELLALCILLEPSLFTNSHLFILDENGEILKTSNNEFYELKATQFGLHINSEILIAGKMVRALKIMIFDSYWMRKFYYNPIKSIQCNPYRTSDYSYRGEYNKSQDSSSSNPSPSNEVPFVYKGNFCVVSALISGFVIIFIALLFSELEGLKIKRIPFFDLFEGLKTGLLLIFLVAVVAFFFGIYASWWGKINSKIIMIIFYGLVILFLIFLGSIFCRIKWLVPVVLNPISKSVNLNNATAMCSSYNMSTDDVQDCSTFFESFEGNSQLLAEFLEKESKKAESRFIKHGVTLIIFAVIFIFLTLYVIYLTFKGTNVCHTIGDTLHMTFL